MKKRPIPEWSKVLFALVLAILVGSILGPRAAIFNPIGQVFLHLITMMVIPIVAVSLALAICSINDTSKLGRIGGKTVGIYLFTTSMAVLLGALIGVIVKPGKHLHLEAPSLSTTVLAESPSVLDTLMDLVPSNIFISFIEANMLQIVFFSLFFGLAMNLVEKKYAKPLEAVLSGLSAVLLMMITLVMKVTPIGVFGLMAPMAGQYGLEALKPLFSVIVAVYLGCFLMIGVYSLLLFFTTGINPLAFIRKIFPVQLLAFSTCSSAATLPTTMKTAKEELKMSETVSSFALPLGATINMDGDAIYQGIAVIFTAQIFGIELGVGQLLGVILTATLATIGTAGVPGMGVITLALVLQSIGLPLEGVALLAGIERILDMMRTLTNVTGDLCVAQIVDSTEKRREGVVAKEEALSG